MKKIAIIMGSKNDYPVMQEACKILDLFEIDYLCEVVSAHRTPQKLYSFAENAQEEGIEIIIAGAGGAAHLPGMVASISNLPVIGVPIKSSKLNGLDSLLSIVQMPGGIPVATMAIDGAKNAALFAISILALNNNEIKNKLIEYRNNQTTQVLKDDQLK